MALFKIAEPVLEPVTVADARAWLRISHTSEDALLGDLISAARQDVENQTGLSLISQQWRMTMDNWPDGDLVELPRGPVTGIVAVTVYAANGAPSVAAPMDYLLDMRSDPARLLFEKRANPGRRMNGIEVDFSTGFGATERVSPIC